MILGVMQLLVVLVSWLIPAAMPDVAMRSLLSSEGLRWFFGRFTSNLAHPLLVWFILLYVAFIAYRQGGLQHALTSVIRGERLLLRQRTALWLVIAELVVILCVIIGLVFIPHAVLLSATGALFPSSFAASLVPLAAFTLFIVSVSYAAANGQLRHLSHPVNNHVAHWLLIYILAMQLWQSILFVFS
ncbi:MAG: ABC transporter substrate-binding protein [Prevotella sp.]|nr:ABC transporter substrate-binding protein [Prevotella sp.]